jgi:Transposase DDE domain
MHNQIEITTIYVIADEFCKSFHSLLQTKVMYNEQGKRLRNKPCTLSDAEVITILIFFHLKGYRNMKHYYINYIQKHLRTDFPVTVSYTRFVELSQRVCIPMILLLKSMMKDKCTGISFVDSTVLKVCNNRRIHSHKVFKGIANRGHSSVGYFFGFKLHLVINDKGELLNYVLTKANKHDANIDLMNILVEDLFGKLYGDKGYLSKNLFETLFHKGVHVVTKIRRNMKNCLMSLSDKIMLRKRAVVECVNDELKNICQIEHSRHRSIANFISNLVSGLLAYCFLPKKPSVHVEFEQPSPQLALLP